MDISNTRSEGILVIWLLSDDKPGHVNQTEGLVQALSNYRELKISRPPLLSLVQALKMLLLKRSDKKGNQESPDLIIGTGHLTHLSLLSYRRCFGGKSVVMMSPSLPYRFFDLCFIPRHDKPPKKNNIIETLGAINRIVPDPLSHQENVGLILLGGPSKHYSWDSTKVVEQLKKLIEREPNTRWIVAGSRRTPISFYDEISSHVSAFTIMKPEDVSSDWLPQQMLEAEYIWVTTDSISMIYEALTSGAKTGILELSYNKSTRITQEIDRLLNEGNAISIESEKYSKLESSIFEADRCARILLEKLDL